MTSMKEYYASRDASKVYQSVSILLFYILKLLPKVFKKIIQEGLEISPNIATLWILQRNRLLKPINRGFNDYKIIFITLFHSRYIRTVSLFYLQTETHNIITKA